MRVRPWILAYILPAGTVRQPRLAAGESGNIWPIRHIAAPNNIRVLLVRREGRMDIGRQPAESAAAFLRRKRA